MAKRLTIKPPGAGRAKGRGRKVQWSRIFKVLALAGVVALAIRLFLLQPYQIPSRSMEDSLLMGDCLLIDKLSYGVRLPLLGWRTPGLTQPQPGDVVIFKSPEEENRTYIKRCVAGPGQVVEIRDKALYIDGLRVADPPFSKYIDARILSQPQSPRDNFGPQRVPEGSFFVLGDNRDNSRDSRHWGFLPVEQVVGRALCIYWSARPTRQSVLARLVSLPQRMRWKRLGSGIP